MHGFYRIAAICPKTGIADVKGNTAEIIRCGKEALAEGASILVFPELCITSASCGDLFLQKLLPEQAKKALFLIAQAFAETDAILAVGLPVRSGVKLYNCAAILQGGQVKAFVPKSVIRDSRIFTSGTELLKNGGVISGIPVTNLFPVNEEITLGVELGEDLFCSAPPSGNLAAAGAGLILNLSADTEYIAKAAYRRELVKSQSGRCSAVYAYASAGVHETTTDTVCGGHLLIAENGVLLSENKRFRRDSEILYADADLGRLNELRLREGLFRETPEIRNGIPLDVFFGVKKLKYRSVSPAPFVPESAEERSGVCREVFNIQCAGLAKRMECSGAKKAVIGLSGGLDSTLALLVAAETFRLLKKDPKDILALTMPGFGTTSRTKNNAVILAEQIGAELRTVSIREACLQHFRDIGHDPEKLDVTYENTQARERTQILMDMANREQGLVIGTGDLSEIALGWCTYNADHISMYGVNCGVPKTLVRHIVSWYAEQSGGVLAETLNDVVATPVSPELLPADKDGNIQQKTESILGSYDLHDFFLYHFVKYGAAPEKLYFLAEYAFAGRCAGEDIKRALHVFIKRFFTQQFKRSCSPDGPKTGSVSLSARTDWRMPSDASFALWMEDAAKIN